MSACYRVEQWSTTAHPLLASVDNAYILTMSASTRLQGDERKEIASLCKNTFVQINKGWRNCRKAPHITTTAQDLVDAYRNLFVHCEGIHAPILVMEDDAVVLNSDKAHYERVDAFVTNADFNLYSLGSSGFVNPFHFGYHKKFLKTIGFSQAVIWSARARSEALVTMQSTKLMHMDIHIMSKLARKYTYYMPLVVQTLPITENQGTWCYLCNNNAVERAVVHLWVCCLKKIQLDRRPDAWRTVYHVNDLPRYVLALWIVVRLTRAALLGYPRDRR